MITHSFEKILSTITEAESMPESIADLEFCERSAPTSENDVRR